jgi:hypothetical protein
VAQPYGCSPGRMAHRSMSGKGETKSFLVLSADGASIKLLVSYPELVMHFLAWLACAIRFTNGLTVSAHCTMLSPLGLLNGLAF